ncbi:MAG: TonB family protein, partial [Bryobacterales bacterium]|nr:TonB family protein [Bryobacterales bacterium]
AWSAQILILVSVAALAGIALKHPKARLYFWQAVLLLILLLPVVQPWKESPVEAITASASVIVHVTQLPKAAAPWYSRIRWKPEYLLAILAAGTALRLAWIGVGFARLRTYRRHARTIADPPLSFVPQSVRWYVSDAISGPVTYGWLRPSILLPRRVLALPAEMREAIACHELVHVRRGDWIYVLAEETMRGLLWFHPAVWYALSRIQLAREQVVDREAIHLTKDRAGYLDALVAVAEHRLQPDLVPATLFLKKRHLTVRVAEMMKEVSMSRSRVTASLTAVFSAALVGARVAVWFFPMVSPAQTVVDDPGIIVDAGGKLLHRGAVHYAGGPRSAGTVVIDATLNAKGEVSDARVLSGPEELRKAALSGVLDWHYSTEGGVTPHAQITIRFDPPGGASPATTGAIIPPPPPPAPSGSPSRIKSIEFVGVSPEAEQELRNRLQVHEGDEVNTADMQRISRTVQEFDSHLRAGFALRANDPNHEAVLRITVMPQANGSAPLPAVAGGRGGPDAVSPVQSISVPPGTIRVGGNVQAQKIVSKPVPIYPPLAKQARIQGTVSLAVHIAADGTVKDLQVISGHPLLVEAAIDAVKQWVYQPTLLNGNPVDVLTQVDVNFTLSQ